MDRITKDIEPGEHQAGSTGEIVISPHHYDISNIGDEVAALTETPKEAEIDYKNGLRHHGGRKPVPADFADILTPEGNSGDIFGTDIIDDPFDINETSTVATPQ